MATTLTSSYQYLGRSAKMPTQSGNYAYYILLYGKTVANNTTGIHTVSIKEVLVSTANNGTYNTYSSSTVGKINGTTVFSSAAADQIPNWSWNNHATLVAGGTTYKESTTLKEGSTTVSATDGKSKDITVSCSYTFLSRGASYTPEQNAVGSVSVTVTLPAIPRESTISCAATCDIGKALSLSISKQNTAFTSTVTYSFQGTTGTIATKSSSTSISWTVPTSFYALIPNSISAACTFYVTTFNGNTQIGSAKSATCQLYANQSLSGPTLSPTIIDTNSASVALTGANNVLIKGVSNAQITFNASARNSATISSKKCTNGSRTITTDSTLNKVDSQVFSFSVTDSRGYTTSLTLTPIMVNYIDLTCNLNVENISTLGATSVTVSGKYFSGSFGAQSNALIIQYKYKKSSASTWGSWIAIQSPTILNNEYSGSANITGLDYRESYDFEAVAFDKVNVLGAFSDTVSRSSLPIFDFGKNDFNFNVPITYKGDTIDLVIDTGAGTGSWEYRKWEDGTLECWRYKDVTGSITSAWGSMYTGLTCDFGNYPEAFISEPAVTYGVSTNNMNGWIATKGETAKATIYKPCAVQFVRPVSDSTSTTVRYSVHALGRWK